MNRPTCRSKIALGVVSASAVSAFLAFQGTLYRLEEVFVCWLFFTLAFLLITMAAGLGMAIYWAILGVFRFITGAARTIPPVPLTNPTLHPKP